MWTKRQTSHTGKYSTPHVLISSLISELIAKKTEGAWTHFEVISNQGWLKNLLFGKAPSVEIATDDFRTLQLNLGLGKQQSDIPVKWKQEKSGIYLIPDSDIAELVDWITKEFIRVTGNKDFQLAGWIEGL
ncbi:MAG TPA: hypothetical protein DCZ95_09785 [Verrucomicrobia bacterium]|nr:hypothetical protein [Verrucomicrobiota bacterium]